MIAILTTLLPLLLKYVVPLISAWFAARGHATLGATPDATPEQIQQLLGGWSAIAASSIGSGMGLDWWKRSSEKSSIDWSKVVAGLAANGGFNLIKAIALIARVFQLVSQDPEARRLFAEAFGTPVASMPQDANGIYALSLSRKE